MRPETAAMSVSVAALDKSNSKKRRPSSVIGKFFDKISFKMGPAEGQDVPPPLPMYETVSRGWDATNMRWKSVIWPTLDHEFHGVPNTSERAAWKLRWHTDHETSAPNTPVTDLAPGAPIGTIPAVIISQAMPIPRSNAPAGLSSGSSILTDLSENAQSRSSLFDPDGSLDTATVATSFDSSYAVERKKSRNQS
ncbi:hypothetical protein B0H17DRAFT_118899 [Mycena rosella]|uniref:Uncharacterized protein n=1 Tax=Mycena rosella TaxID=1033263 RepID=A0AAD7DYG6_MYCRO|nr:hypothetical protein B0H17DRAFT_118899 [Mycena rosella]